MSNKKQQERDANGRFVKKNDCIKKSRYANALEAIDKLNEIIKIKDDTINNLEEAIKIKDATISGWEAIYRRLKESDKENVRAMNNFKELFLVQRRYAQRIFGFLGFFARKRYERNTKGFLVDMFGYELFV